MPIETFITQDQISPGIYNAIVAVWTSIYNLNQAGLVIYMPEKFDVILDFATAPQSYPVNVQENVTASGSEGGNSTTTETGTDTTVITGTTNQTSNRTTTVTRNTLTTTANTSVGTDTQNTTDSSNSTTYNNSSQERTTDVVYTWTFETAG